MTVEFSEEQVIQLGKAAQILKLPVNEVTRMVCGISFADWSQQRPPAALEKLAADQEQTSWLGAVIQGLIHEATAPAR